MSGALSNPPLSGIRMIDFGHIVAGPFCARLLADLGVDLIKVETATREGRTGARRSRSGGRQGDGSGRTPLLAHINRNRRSIDLNLKSEQGRDMARRLIDSADGLVENFSSGVMDRLGLGYDEVSKSNPRLVYASMSAYGHSGPRNAWTGMNVNLQAYSGMMMATGGPSDPPIGISNSWNDYIGGLHAAVAIVGALFKRVATGRGFHIDLSQFESSVGMVGSLLVASAVTGRPPARTGNRSPDAAPQGCYPCAGTDQWCVVSVQNDAQWQALVADIGDADLRQAKFATLAGRLQHHDEIDAALSRWTRQLAPSDIEQRLSKRGVAASAMRRGNQLADATEWRGIVRSLAGSQNPGDQTVGFPAVFRGNRPVEPHVAPRMGQHGREILRDWLRMDDRAIDEFMGETAA
jgi:benzylsuccinate CoA-transferase BbsF subunit